jgi:hypothetical protein
MMAYLRDAQVRTKTLAVESITNQDFRILYKQFRNIKMNKYLHLRTLFSTREQLLQTQIITQLAICCLNRINRRNMCSLMKT